MEGSFFSLFRESLVSGLAKKRAAILCVIIEVTISGIVLVDISRHNWVALISAWLVLCESLSHRLQAALQISLSLSILSMHVLLEGLFGAHHF